MLPKRRLEKKLSNFLLKILDLIKKPLSLHPLSEIAALPETNNLHRVNEAKAETAVLKKSLKKDAKRFGGNEETVLSLHPLSPHKRGKLKTES